MVKRLRDMSGFGWDEGRRMVTATADVWEALLKVCTYMSVQLICEF